MMTSEIGGPVVRRPSTAAFLLMLFTSITACGKWRNIADIDGAAPERATDGGNPGRGGAGDKDAPLSDPDPNSGSGGRPASVPDADAGVVNPDVPGSPSADGGLPACSMGKVRCGGDCVEGCCIDADCPPQSLKAGRCDQATRKCSYECAVDAKPCNGTCVPVQSCCPGTEICDGKDNDCDGAIDEELSMDCKTACGSGKQACSGGMWSMCSAAMPVLEACDGKDNDCDGAIDEELSMDCKTACGSGKQMCLNGAWTSCSAPMPTVETCDNKDNDCNGMIDEGLKRQCSSACGLGEEVCQRGQWGVCNAKKPSNSDPAACGAQCEACRAPTRGTAICQNGRCDYTCGGATKTKCNNGCFECCAPDDCPDRDGATKQCLGNKCDYKCAGITCGSKCIPDTGACLALTADVSWEGDCNFSVCNSASMVCKKNKVRRTLMTPNNTEALKQNCQAEFMSLKTQLCSDPSIVARNNAGEKVDIYFYVEQFAPNGQRASYVGAGLNSCP